MMTTSADTAWPRSAPARSGYAPSATAPAPRWRLERLLINRRFSSARQSFRQMRVNHSRYLFLERYDEGATRDQFIAFFKTAGIQVVFREDVESSRRNDPLTTLPA